MCNDATHVKGELLTFEAYPARVTHPEMLFVFIERVENQDNGTVTVDVPIISHLIFKPR